MTTIFLFSDIHNNRTVFTPSLLDVAFESDYVCFAGDGIGVKDAFSNHPHFLAVSGNCDADKVGDEVVFEVEGVKILLTHGHLYNAHYDLLPLAYRAKEVGASVVFYGHTHQKAIDTFHGVTLINPGALCGYGCRPSYAYVVVHNGKVVPTLVDVYPN